MAKTSKKPPIKKASKARSSSKNKKKPVKKVQKKTALSSVKKKTMRLLKVFASKKKPSKEKKKAKPTKLNIPSSASKTKSNSKMQKEVLSTKELKLPKEIKSRVPEPLREEVIYNPKFEYVPFNPPILHKRPGRILTAEGFARLYESSHSS